MKKFLMIALLLATIPAIAAQPPQDGRYQIIFNPSVRADTFLLDTQTGKVWQKVVFTDMDGEPSVWDIMDRIDGMKEYLQWRKAHYSKEEAARFKEEVERANAEKEAGQSIAK